jgi:hypothetical protein
MSYVRRVRGVLAVIVMPAVLAVGCGAGCSDRDRATSERATAVAEPTDVADQALMLALSQAKNLHHKAKVYMTDGKLDDAIAAVRAILSLRFPAGALEADDVRDDARALLAKLLVEQGKLDDAMTVVMEGIGPSQRDSFFVANLWTVKGEIHEARAAQLDASDKAKASDEKRAAIEAYDRSIQIDQAIQKRVLEDR